MYTNLRTNTKFEVYLLESLALPMVDIQLTFNAGSVRDVSRKKGPYGVANMAAQLIDEGTTQHDAVEIANAFEQVGARFTWLYTVTCLWFDCVLCLTLKD